MLLPTATVIRVLVSLFLLSGIGFLFLTGDTYLRNPIYTSLEDSALVERLKTILFKPVPVPSNIAMALDTENYEVPPRELELEQVHLYLRHGERSPVGTRLNHPPANLPEHWNLCKSARTFTAAVYPHTTLKVKRVSERADGSSVDGECLPGELTDLGRKSTLNYGLALRKLYVDRLGFLPSTLEGDGVTYFRSTNLPRTVESLQQVIQGLYPTAQCGNGFIPRVRMRPAKDENLYGNTMACPRLKELEIQFGDEAADRCNPDLAGLDDKLCKFNNGVPIRLDGKPRASGIFDTIRAAKAHGIPVPPEFDDPAIMDVLEKAVCDEWFSGYRDSHEFRRLAMSRLLDDLQHKMQRKADAPQKDPLKIAVHTCHDTSLAGLLTTLDVFDFKWPAFTASVTFELFKKIETPAQPSSWWQSIFGTKQSTEYYVRTRYQNQNMKLPACAGTGKHLPGSPEFCTLKAFQEKVQTLTPHDWDHECAAHGRKTDLLKDPPAVQN